MAKYSQESQKQVRKAIKEYKAGKLTSGKSATKAKSRKQAIAIGLSKARKAGARVPEDT